MFNIQPGTGLGFTASKQIALGLGMPWILIIEVVKREVVRLVSSIHRTIRLISRLS